MIETLDDEHYIITVPEDEAEYEIYRCRTDPKKCDACDKTIRRRMYYSMSDAGDIYCVKCCTR